MDSQHASLLRVSTPGRLRAPLQRELRLKRGKSKLHVQLRARLYHRSSPDSQHLKTWLCLETRFFKEEVRSAEGLPRRLSGKDSACDAGDIGDQSLGGEDPLEEEMATHSSALAWRIPCTEEPGGLQSMGSQKGRTQVSN